MKPMKFVVKKDQDFILKNNNYYEKVGFVIIAILSRFLDAWNQEAYILGKYL